MHKGNVHKITYAKKAFFFSNKLCLKQLLCFMAFILLSSDIGVCDTQFQILQSRMVTFRFSPWYLWNFLLLCFTETLTCQIRVIFYRAFLQCHKLSELCLSEKFPHQKHYGILPNESNCYEKTYGVFEFWTNCLLLSPPYFYSEMQLHYFFIQNHVI